MNLYFFFLFIVVGNVNGQNNLQTSVVTYKIIVNSNLGYSNLSKTEKDKIKLITNSTKLIECQLYFNSYSSLFQQVKKMGLENDYSYKLASTFIRGVNYSNIKDEKRILVKNISDEVFLVSMPYKQYEWVVTKESKKIGNYICYKAIGTKAVLNSITNNKKQQDIVAWFAPKIGVPFGPNGIDGLPGLILETTFNNVCIYATDINLNDTNENALKPPTEGKEITEEAYLKLIHAKFTSLFEEN